MYRCLDFQFSHSFKKKNEEELRNEVFEKFYLFNGRRFDVFLGSGW